MLRDYTLLVRLFMVTVVPIVSIILLIISRKERKLQILTLTAVATIFFFMFFFGIYVRVPNINEDNAEKIWDTLSALDFGEPRPDFESSEIKNYATYEEDRDKYKIIVEKWTSNEVLDLDLWYRRGSYPPNGLRLIYELLPTDGEGTKYAWKISPLYAGRVSHDIYAFTGWYKGSFIIKKDVQYIRCTYGIKTSTGNLSAFMCIPPIGFDLEEFIMQFAEA